MPDQVKPKGILRNRGEAGSPLPQQQPTADTASSVTSTNTSSTSSTSTISPEDPSILRSNNNTSAGNIPFDRNAVLENTLANAKFHTVGNAIIKKHKVELDEDIHHGASSSSGDVAAIKAAAEHLKWNEANLYLNEQEKCSTMKITEPKTPFQGAVGDSEYYKPDAEGDEDDDLDGESFLLGEPEVAVGPDPTIQQDRIIVDEKARKEEEEAAAAAASEEEPEETPEERHQRFEQLRKSHYFMKGAVLHKPGQGLDEEDQ